MPKHKITANIQWEIETESDKILEMAEKELFEILPKSICGRILKIDNLRPRKGKKLIGEFQPQDVFPYICCFPTQSPDRYKRIRRKYVVGNETFHVKMNSQRYFIFKSCPCCVSCGIKGNKFFLEKNSNDKFPHFNFYAVNGDEKILMTKDHILPKSFGGEDRHSNYQTMCEVCNNLKSHYSLKIEHVREIRDAYESNKNRMTKKQLNRLICELRYKLQSPIQNWQPLEKKKGLKNHLVSNFDLSIVEKNGVLKAVLINDQFYDEHIGCIKKNSHISNFHRSNSDLGFNVELNDEYFFVADFLVEEKNTL